MPSNIIVLLAFEIFGVKGIMVKVSNIEPDPFSGIVHLHSGTSL